MNANNIKVSVICTAYNHEPYIREALEGFISQKADFPFEVIIHDDASTDKTAEVIKEYARKYPEIIKPIIQEANQYSQGVDISRDILLPKTQGKYIAFCEGDDCWTDDFKLQKQFDWMESHPDYSMCIHNAFINNQRSRICYLSEADSGDRDKSFSQIICEGGGFINPTASFFIKKSLFDRDNKMGFEPPVGDHFYMIEMASKGKVRWMSKPMSMYRAFTETSWTTNWLTRDPETIISYHAYYIEALKWFDEYSGHIAEDAFSDRIEHQINVCQQDYSEVSLYRGSRRVSARDFFSKRGVQVFAKKYLPPKAQKILLRKRDVIQSCTKGLLVAKCNLSREQLKELSGMAKEHI